MNHKNRHEYKETPRERLSDPNDRRAALRYIPSENRCQLGWWQGTVFREIAGEIQDLSMSGIQIAVQGIVPEQATIYIRFDKPTATDWCEMRVIDLSANSEGGILLRMQFEGSCPYEFFKLGVFSR